MSSQTFVDDRDPQLIYFGDWLLDGTGNPKIYAGTLSECQTASSGVTLQFNGESDHTPFPVPFLLHSYRYSNLSIWDGPAII